uniref:Poly(ADP-ribose) polymerase family member 6 n=1 Tax=Kryptolebias marmoratus TaxID=37003 RepID=A0A3Q2ZT30_KRYMA
RLQECQPWTESCSDEDSDSEDSLWEIQESCAAEPYRHPQLDTDMEAVRTLYSDSAVSVREYPSIDGVDVDLNISTNFLDVEVAKAWRINPSEPIVIRLHFSLSQYLDGPGEISSFSRPTRIISAWGYSCSSDILTVFINEAWEHLLNDDTDVRPKSQLSWFRPSETIKKFSAQLSIWLPLSKYEGKHLSAVNKKNFLTLTASYAIKNPAGELFTYTADGKVGTVCCCFLSKVEKAKPLTGYKTLVRKLTVIIIQIMKYAEQRIPTLNEFCVVCDEQHVFQNDPLLKTAVCTRELCVFSFHTLGVMSGATEEVATGAEVVDLLVAMCRAALQSSRKSIIFEPYPSVVDPRNPKSLAFSPKKKSYERLQRALDGVLLVRRMAQGPFSEVKKQMDEIDPLAHPLLQWILASNRSHIVKLPLNKLTFMRTPHQFLLLSSPPSKELRFQAARKLHGSTFAFHGSHIENWHSILRTGLVSASYTKLQVKKH